MRGERPKAAAAPSGIDVFIDLDQAALDAIPTGLCVCSAEGVLFRYNRRAVELWGRAPRLGDPKEQQGSGFRRYRTDGAPLPFAATPVGNALRSGQPIVGAEVIIEQPDGTRVPVLMNVAPLKSRSGRVQGAVCSFQALTERKRIEEALRASEAELQSVINRTPFMLVRCSRDLHYRFVSQAYAQLVGVPREQIIGKTIVEAIGATGYNTLRPHIEKVLRGEATEFDCEIDFPVAGSRRLHIAYRPETDATGKVDGWIASLLDITEQSRAVQAREQLASIVESSGDAIVSKTLDGIIVSWNSAAERLLLGWSEDEACPRSTAWRTAPAARCRSRARSATAPRSPSICRAARRRSPRRRRKIPRDLWPPTRGPSSWWKTTRTSRTSPSRCCGSSATRPSPWNRRPKPSTCWARSNARCCGCPRRSSTTRTGSGPIPAG